MTYDIINDMCSQSLSSLKSIYLNFTLYAYGCAQNFVSVRRINHRNMYSNYMSRHGACVAYEFNFFFCADPTRFSLCTEICKLLLRFWYSIQVQYLSLVLIAYEVWSTKFIRFFFSTFSISHSMVSWLSMVLFPFQIRTWTTFQTFLITIIMMMIKIIIRKNKIFFP